jgi:hypothetical protein
MCTWPIIARFAGLFILLSVGLGWFVSPWFYAFTAFVGANLVQYSVTGFCPLERMLGAAQWFGCRRARTAS